MTTAEKLQVRSDIIAACEAGKVVIFNQSWTESGTTRIRQYYLTDYNSYADSNLKFITIPNSEWRSNYSPAAATWKTSFLYLLFDASGGLNGPFVLDRVALNVDGNMDLRPGSRYGTATSIGTSSDKFNNAYFSGNVTANNIPAPPSADGTYTLTCTISSGSITYSWT